MNQRGFTVVEALIGTVIGTIVLAGGYRLWKTHSQQGFLLQKKAELRDKMTLSSKHIQRSITLAGLGLGRVPTLVREDAIGSDTLFVYTNESERKAGLLSNLYTGQYAIYVDNGSAFANSLYMAVTDGTRGEVKPIDRVQGNVVVLRKPLESPYNRIGTTAMPARREKYYSDQDSLRLMRVVDGRTAVLAEDVRNFQVSFRDRSGAATDDSRAVRAVHFSFTGTFPAREGTLNSVLFTSTAIPRNIL